MTDQPKPPPRVWSAQEIDAQLREISKAAEGSLAGFVRGFLIGPAPKKRPAK